MKAIKSTVLLVIIMVLLSFSGCRGSGIIPFDRNSFLLTSNTMSIDYLTSDNGWAEVYRTDDTEFVGKVVDEIGSIIMTEDPLEALDMAMVHRLVFDDGTVVNYYCATDPGDTAYMRYQDKWLFVMSDKLVEMIYPLVSREPIGQ